jgi:sortase A
VGRTLIAFGTLMLLFVAYELWGTNIAEARSQRELKREFAQIVTATTTPPGTTPETTSTVPATPAPEGEAVALIEIPKIGVNKAVVAGVGVPDLKKGPGHYPGTPLPGEAGNAAIAGHRTTYGAPFNRLDELNPGDQILVTTRAGRFTYEVGTSIVVKPTEVAVLNPTTDNRLTLTTCNPKYSARQRLIVVSHLVGEPPPPPPAATGEPARPAPRPRAPEAGLSGESAARRPTVLWGAIVAAVAFLIWLLGRLWRRWPVYLVGAPVFLVVLFIFFENVSRLLPANV